MTRMKDSGRICTLSKAGIQGRERRWQTGTMGGRAEWLEDAFGLFCKLLISAPHLYPLNLLTAVRVPGMCTCAF